MASAEAEGASFDKAIRLRQNIELCEDAGGAARRTTSLQI
jgi:hypothetical protein